MRAFIIIGIGLFLFSGCARFNALEQRTIVMQQDMGKAKKDIRSLQSRTSDGESRLNMIETRVHSLEPKVFSDGKEVPSGNITIIRGKMIIDQ